MHKIIEEIEKLFLTSHVKMKKKKKNKNKPNNPTTQKPKLTKSILKMNNARVPTVPNFKVLLKMTLVKAVSCWTIDSKSLLITIVILCFY